VGACLVLCRLLWPTVTLPSPSAFYLKSQPSSIRTLSAWHSLFYGFCFHENFWHTVARQNAVDIRYLFHLWRKDRDSDICWWSCVAAFGSRMGILTYKSVLALGLPVVHMHTVERKQSYFQVIVITRWEAMASPSIGFTLFRVWTLFTRSTVTPPEVNRFGWNLGHSEYIVCRWPWQTDFGHPRRSERTRRNFVFCPVNNARLYRFPIGQIWRNLHTRRGSVCVVMNPFGTKFWKSFRKGSFSKRQIFGENLQRDISEMIINRGNSQPIGPLRNIDFPFLPLESTKIYTKLNSNATWRLSSLI